MGRDSATLEDHMKENGLPDGICSDCHKGMALWDGRMQACMMHNTEDCPDWLTVLEERIHESGLGPRYWHGTLEKVPDAARAPFANWLKQIMSQVLGGFEGFLLHGDAGTGKSTMLGMAAQAAVRARLHVRYTTVAQFLHHLHRRSDAGDRLLHEYRETQLLLLDEWGGAYQSDYGSAGLDALMEDRYANEYCTCVATNASLAELTGNPEWGRIVSRWRDMCPLVIDTGSVDQRGRRE